MLWFFLTHVTFVSAHVFKIMVPTLDLPFGCRKFFLGSKVMMNECYNVVAFKVMVISRGSLSLKVTPNVAWGTTMKNLIFSVRLISDIHWPMDASNEY